MLQAKAFGLEMPSECECTNIHMSVSSHDRGWEEENPFPIGSSSLR